MKIVFICTGNTCRSPMAKALMEKKARDRNLDIECSSKGIAAFTGDSVSENSVKAMKGYGIDISSHRASRLTHYDIDESDLLVCMTKAQATALSAFAEEKVTFLEGEIPDPYGMDEKAYKDCAEKIDKALDILIDNFSLDVTISPIGEDDVADIAEIEKDCFSTPWSENAIRDELTNEGARFCILRKDGEALGYMGMHIVLDECYIANIAVKKTARKQGFGAKLLEHSIKKAQNEGCSFISLEVRVSNLPAISLYKKYGFSCVGERKNFYTDPTENALIMTKFFSEVKE